MANLSPNSDFPIIQVWINPIGIQSVTDEPKKAPSISTPDLGP